MHKGKPKEDGGGIPGKNMFLMRNYMSHVPVNLPNQRHSYRKKNNSLKLLHAGWLERLDLSSLTIIPFLKNLISLPLKLVFLLTVFL